MAMESKNPYALPPRDMKDMFKKYQKMHLTDHESDENLIDFGKINQTSEKVVFQNPLPSQQLLPVFQHFAEQNCEVLTAEDAAVYTLEALPGLFIIPGLLPPGIQRLVLQQLLHKNLSDPKHQTNLHLHYEVPYPRNTSKFAGENATNSSNSLFSFSPNSTVKFKPKDPHVHKALSISQVMQKKLRWITLGGQYDWTNKIYPQEEPPAFPADLAALLEGLFPDMRAQAAIVNLYSPGDTLSLHRDVSEECDRGLISISLGCDCIFLIGLENQVQNGINDINETANACVAIRLRSGDAVYMSKESRYAWHGVPKILSDTCPSYLEDWPASSDGQYEDWRGWMKNKRVNLNVRQMFG